MSYSRNRNFTYLWTERGAHVLFSNATLSTGLAHCAQGNMKYTIAKRIGMLQVRGWGGGRKAGSGHGVRIVVGYADTVPV